MRPSYPGRDVLVANTSVHLGWFPLFCILLALILLIALADIRISTRIRLVFAAIGVLAIVAPSLAIVAKGGANGLTWRPFDPGVSPSGHGLASQPSPRPGCWRRHRSATQTNIRSAQDRPAPLHDILEFHARNLPARPPPNDIRRSGMTAQI